MPRTKSTANSRPSLSSSSCHSDSDSNSEDESQSNYSSQHRQDFNSSLSRSQLHHQSSSENVAKFISRSAVTSAPGFYTSSLRSQDFYIQEDIRPSRSPDSQSSRLHSYNGTFSRGEPSALLSTSAKNVGFQDDFTHRTPHFGYTSEIREQPGHAANAKDKAVDNTHRQDGHISRSKDSHDRNPREKDITSSKHRQEVDPFLRAPDLPVDESSRFTEELLAAFERRIDKKIRNMNAALGSAPDSFTMLCTHPPAVNMFMKYVEEQQQMQEELQLIVQLSKTMAYEHKHQFPSGSIPIFSPE